MTSSIETDTVPTIVQNIRNSVKARGKTIADISRAAFGADRPNALSKMLNKWPQQRDLPTLHKIAKALDTTVADLEAEPVKVADNSDSSDGDGNSNDKDNSSEALLTDMNARVERLTQQLETARIQIRQREHLISSLQTQRDKLGEQLSLRNSRISGLSNRLEQTSKTSDELRAQRNWALYGGALCATILLSRLLASLA